MPGSIKIDDGSGNYTILTNAGSLGSDKTLTIPNTTGTAALTSDLPDNSCQQFRLNTNNTTGGDITSGWEVPDGTLQANFGSNVSESSGIYTFAKTGFYKVYFWGTIHSSNEIETDIRIMVSTDAFSSVDTEAALATQRIQPSDDGSTVTTSCILDITDLSNHKVKFKWSELVGSATLVGNSSYNRTFVEFMRLGDT